MVSAGHVGGRVIVCAGEPFGCTPLVLCCLLCVVPSL